MASSAVALPNGLPDAAHPAELEMTDAMQDSAPAPVSAPPVATATATTAPSTKRKREDNDDSKDAATANGPHTKMNGIESHGDANGTPTTRPTEAEVATIRDYLAVLEQLDPVPSVLKRPLPSSTSNQEPDAKRQKSEEGILHQSVADKAAEGQYKTLDDMLFDIKASVNSQIAELRSAEAIKESKVDEKAVAQTFAFGKKASQLCRQEMTYPRPTTDYATLRDADVASDLQSKASGNVVLTVHGEAPRPRQLYSSLQRPVSTAQDSQGTMQVVQANKLPKGVRLAEAMPYHFANAVDKDKKGKTLGELFPAPRNLPSLPPPKAPKSATKGVHVGWHRPELTDKSKFRSGSYFSQVVSTGRWLDYSNAAPPSQILTKQRERALSLAGSKPSTSELESSEMETLFRGAFSSFAPSKDDSAAMISSGLISHTMWWQKVGKRSFDRLVDAEGPEAPEESDKVTDEGMEVDEELIQEALEQWDENKIDPSLEAACCPTKPEEDKDVADILLDVSDMIQTLISLQKIRNLALPSSQSRYTADPSHSDMLTIASPVQPTEEETATYEALKAQLSLVIQMLPPYAVARLNSDKLEELDLSMKLEIRADEYQGVMEEDESAARARAAQQAAAAPRPSPHRASSSSSNLPYGAQYPGSVNRAAMPATGYYGAQTPTRTPVIQRVPSGVAAAFSQQRQPSGAGYRPPNGYSAGTNFSQSFNRTSQSYQQGSQYSGTPQSRPPYQAQPTYHNMGGAGNTRYGSGAANTQGQPYQQQSFSQHSQTGTGTPSYGQHSAYANGANMPQRTQSPHVNSQQPSYMHQGYNSTATPSRQPSLSAQPKPAGPQAAQQRFSGYGQSNSPVPLPQIPGHATQSQPQHAPQTQQGQQGQGQQTQGQVFATSLNPFQVQQAMDQAKARFDAQNKAQRSNESIRPPGPGHNQSLTPTGTVQLKGPSPSPGPHAGSPAPPRALPATNGGTVGQADAAVPSPLGTQEEVEA